VAALPRLVSRPRGRGRGQRAAHPRLAPAAGRRRRADVRQRGAEPRAGPHPHRDGCVGTSLVPAGEDIMEWKPKKTVGQMVEAAKTRIENLSVEQLEAEMARGDVQVLDIRDVRERRKLGFIPGSMHVPRGMLEFWLDPTSHYYSGKIDPTKRIIVYCAGGQRSALAADVLREMGFPNVAHLAVGFTGWAEAGRTIERESEG